MCVLILWFVLDWSGFKQAFSKKGTARGLNSGVAVILGIAVAFAIGFLSKRDRFNLSFDVSRDGINTLSDQSKKAIDSLMGTDKSLSLKTFFQDDLKQNKFEQKLLVNSVDYKTDSTNTLIGEYETRYIYNQNNQDIKKLCESRQNESRFLFLIDQI